jgi:hypothetical protein
MPIGKVCFQIGPDALQRCSHDLIGHAGKE